MKYTIIAPHPDDELIGCYTLIKKKRIKNIVYVDCTINSERFYEAKKFCNFFKINMICMKNIKEKKKFLNDFYQILENIKDTSILVPSPMDNHPLHNFLFYLSSFLRNDISIYSTRMNDFFIRELSETESKEKQSLLNKFYPSQKILWKNEYKYFLFEGIL